MNLLPAWLVVADDLTGACDTGAAFAMRGWPTRVAFSPGADFASARVWVVSTESRALTPAKAVQAVEQAARALALPEGALVYKKIDSTLRGYPGAELNALMRVLGADRALVAPAFPEQGRVTRAGQVWVNGQPLAQTSFGREVPEPALARLFGTDRPARLLGLAAVRGAPDRLAAELAQPGITVADAERPEDLLALSRAGLAAGLRLWCGSAGLARALIGLHPAGDRPVPILHHTTGSTALAVVGSRSPAAAAQIAEVRQAGIAVFSPDLSSIRITNIANQAEQLVTEVACELSSGGLALISAADTAEQPGGELAVARVLGDLAAGVLAAVPGTRLVLTGGDTAAAACRALDCDALDLDGEIEPGVVWGRLAAGTQNGLPVVTKAGGFGGPQTLLHALRFLTGRPLVKRLA